MDVVQELKLKRAELSERLKELSKLQSELQEQIRSIDTVITIYEPSYVTTGFGGTGRSRSSSRKEDPVRDEVTALMKTISHTQIILETLREAPTPLTAADCTMSVASQLGLSSDDPKIPYITSRVAATLGSLAKRGRVRPAGMADSRRHLWEVAV